MKFYIETERLILRDLLPTDDEGMFALDSNTEVHRYLGNRPIHTIDQAREVIAIVHQQYEDNGIGRWASIERSYGNFIGWSGLKYVTAPENNHSNYYDVGYRFVPRYWGKGYATEATKAALDFGFKTLQLKEIVGTCHEENIESRRVLEKCGLKFVEKFLYRNECLCDWLTITREEWGSNNQH